MFTDNITTTESNGKTEINVDYFSVPKPIKLEWLKDDNILYMSEKYIQNNILADISLTFHKVKVKLTGYRSTITIMAPDQKDYGNYVLRVQNAKETVLQKIPYFPTGKYFPTISLSCKVLLWLNLVNMFWSFGFFNGFTVLSLSSTDKELNCKTLFSDASLP